MNTDVVEVHATALADAIDGALAAWVERSVLRVAAELGGETDLASLSTEARRAAQEAHDDLVPRVRALLALDIDEQRCGPLELLREAVRYPTAVLAASGVPEADRDDTQRRLFPDDPYDLAPARFADFDPVVGELGLVWGAAKAFEHLRRRRPDPTEEQP